MKKRREEPADSNLDLAPFMNMVVILIPLLLLSVIFVSVGVINVSSPSLTPCCSSDDTPEESLDLTVAVSKEGFEVVTGKGPRPALEDCPPSGPTVCLADASVDLDRHFAGLQDSKRIEASQHAAAIEEAMSAYDFRRLYNTLATIKEAHPDETRIVLTGDPDIPYALLVRVMDVARFQLQDTHYPKTSQFWATVANSPSGAVEPMFSDPVLAVAQ